MLAEPAARRQAQGFTLLEVLVAFVIAAMALSVLYRGALGGAVSARVAGQYEEAVSRARSRLTAIGAGSAIVAGEQSGDDGAGFAFHTRIAPTQSAPPPAGPIKPRTLLPVLYAVSVDISWGTAPDARHVQLDTQRLGFAAPVGP